MPGRQVRRHPLWKWRQEKAVVSLWVQVICSWDMAPICPAQETSSACTKPPLGQSAKASWTLILGWPFVLDSTIHTWGKESDVSCCAVYNPIYIPHDVSISPTHLYFLGLPFTVLHLLLAWSALSNLSCCCYPSRASKEYFIRASSLSLIHSSEQRTKWTPGHWDWEATIFPTDCFPCSLSPIL